MDRWPKSNNWSKIVTSKSVWHIKIRGRSWIIYMSLRQRSCSELLLWISRRKMSSWLYQGICKILMIGCLVAISKLTNSERLNSNNFGPRSSLTTSTLNLVPQAPPKVRRQKALQNLQSQKKTIKKKKLKI